MYLASDPTGLKDKKLQKKRKYDEDKKAAKVAAGRSKAVAKETMTAKRHRNTFDKIKQINVLSFKPILIPHQADPTFALPSPPSADVMLQNTTARANCWK